jgi:hypothetical protein
MLILKENVADKKKRSFFKITKSVNYFWSDMKDATVCLHFNPFISLKATGFPHRISNARERHRFISLSSQLIKEAPCIFRVGDMGCVCNTKFFTEKIFRSLSHLFDVYGRLDSDLREMENTDIPVSTMVKKSALS